MSVNLNDLEKDNSKDLLESITIRETGSLVEDIKSMEISTNEVPDIELKEIIIKETGNFLNLKESVVNIPIEMLVFPFFTYQKQNKRVNFEYNFKDLGIVMSSTLILNKKSDSVFQPSTFEEKIYTFLISQYEIKSTSKEKTEYLEFEISDFIVNFLGNKMNRTYYTKVEQALKNLKNTQYQFTVTGHSKLGNYEFEDQSFKLLEYSSLKRGRKRFYRVFLNKNIRKKIEDKRYIIYNTKSLLEILTKDAIASRIYRYISKIRYEKSKDEINIKTLAAIIPLKIVQIAERQDKNGRKKEYYLSRIKQVLKRIEKAFDALIELGYIKEYSNRYAKDEDTYYISYVFNKEKDGKCHISEYIKNKSKEKSENKEIADEKPEVIEFVEPKISEKKPLVKNIQDTFKFPDEITQNINIALRNSNIQSKWGKSVYNKLNKLCEEKGVNFVKDVLKILKDSNTPIKTTLVNYINGIVKNKEDKKNSKNLTLFPTEEKMYLDVDMDIDNNKKNETGLTAIKNLYIEPTAINNLYTEHTAIKDIYNVVTAEKDRNIQKEEKIKELLYKEFGLNELNLIIKKAEEFYCIEKKDESLDLFKEFGIENSIYFNMLLPYIAKAIKEYKKPEEFKTLIDII